MRTPQLTCCHRWRIGTLAVTLLSVIALTSTLYQGPPMRKAWAEPSPYEIAIDKIYRQLLADPELKSRFIAELRANCQGTTAQCRGKDAELGARLAQRGLSRLGSEPLLVRAMIVNRILQSSGQEACVAIARGDFKPDVLRAALERLDPRSLDAWATVSYRAAAAELRQSPRQIPADQQVAAMFRDLVTGLDPAEARRLDSLPEDESKMSDVDACWLTRLMYERLADLREPHRSVLARYLAAGLAPDEGPIAFFSQDGDIAMIRHMGTAVATLLSDYRQPDKKEPFTWRNTRGELWSYVRTTIATNSERRPTALACVRQFYIDQDGSVVHGTWRSGYCHPPYDPKVLDTLTIPGKP